MLEKLKYLKLIETASTVSEQINPYLDHYCYRLL